MRSEKEMFELILGVAERDDRIRAVFMNGSRADANSRKDIFQDYDIVYVVTDTAPFLADPSFTDVFGEKLISEEPDKLDRSVGMDIDFADGYTYLMQFTDGNRIDLHLSPLKNAERDFLSDPPMVKLLDKDGLLPPVPESANAKYIVARPTAEQVNACCVDFWWTAPYCAKGLWRDELLYANKILSSCVREHLVEMLDWLVGVSSDFTVSTGKASKYLKFLLSADDYGALLKTFSSSSVQDAWEALLCACRLFDSAARRVCSAPGLAYDEKSAASSMSFIKHIKELPGSAKEIY